MAGNVPSTPPLLALYVAEPYVGGLPAAGAMNWLNPGNKTWDPVPLTGRQLEVNEGDPAVPVPIAQVLPAAAELLANIVYWRKLPFAANE